MNIKNSFLKSFLGSFSALLAAIILLITFVDSPYIPSWKEIFSSKTVVDEKVDCVTVLDVGQGDCILIQSNGRFALIDTGDGKTANLYRLLKKKGVKGLDAVILSHWHSDHIGGAEEVFGNLPVTNAVLPQINSENSEIDSAAKEILDLCNQYSVSVHTAVQSMVINIGDIQLTVLQSDYEASDENNRSLIIMAECDGVKYLFMGDGEISAERKLIESNIDFDCDILKVSHHGSSTATSKDFLEICTPGISVISVGRKNSYNHPSNDVIKRINATESGIYRTDEDGHITVTFSDGNYFVSTQY